MATLLENARRALAKTSASQIEEWVRCPRRWYNAQVLGLRTPPTDAMTRGTKIHAVLEAHLTGQAPPADADPDHVKRVASAIPHFPPAGKPGLLVEQWIEMATFEGGPKIVGRYDAIDFEARETRGLSSIFDDADHGDGVEVVNFDAKTTSDFRYAKTPAELADNVQMGVYGAHVLEVRPDLDLLGLRHVYVRTRGAARSMPVDVVVSRGQLQERHGKTLNVIREMGAAAREMPVDAAELPANTASCNAFGGCPYRRLCGLDGPVVEFVKDDRERFTEAAEAVLAKVEGGPGGWFSGNDNEKEEEKNMAVTNGEDLMEKLRQRSAARTVGAATPAPAAEKAPPKAEAKPETPGRANPPAPASVAPVSCPTCAGKRYVKATDEGAPPNSYMPCKTCGAAGTVPASVAAKAAKAPAKKPELSDEEKLKKYEVRAAGNGKISTREGDNGEKRDGWILRDPQTDAERKLVADYEKGVAAAREKEARAKAAEDGEPEDETAAPGGASGMVPPDAPSRVDEPAAEAAPVEERPKAKRAPKAAKPAEEPAIDASAGAPSTVVNNHVAAPAPARTTKGPRIYVDCIPTKGADKALAVAYEEWLAPLAAKAAQSACNAKTGQPQPVQDWRLAEYGSGEGLLAVAIREALPTLPEVVVVTGISKARGVFLEQVVPGASLVVKGV